MRIIIKTLCDGYNNNNNDDDTMALTIVLPTFMFGQTKKHEGHLVGRDLANAHRSDPDPSKSAGTHN